VFQEALEVRELLVLETFVVRVEWDMGRLSAGFTSPSGAVPPPNRDATIRMPHPIGYRLRRYLYISFPVRYWSDTGGPGKRVNNRLSGPPGSLTVNNSYYHSY